MRRAIIIWSVLLLFGLFAFYKLATMDMKFLDGSFDLTVEIVNSSPEPIQAVACLVVSTEEAALSVLSTRFSFKGASYSATIDPFVGKPFTVRVPLSSRESIFGQELARAQGRLLAVLVMYQNGERSGKYSAIPDCRESTSVRVHFP